MQLDKCKKETWGVGPGKSPWDHLLWKVNGFFQNAAKTWEKPKWEGVFYKYNSTVTFVWDTKYRFGLQSDVVEHVCINYFFLYLDS